MGGILRIISRFCRVQLDSTQILRFSIHSNHLNLRINLKFHACLRDLSFLYLELHIFKMIVQLDLHVDFTMCNCITFLETNLTVYFLVLEGRGNIEWSSCSTFEKSFRGWSLNFLNPCLPWFCHMNVNINLM